MVWKWIPLVVTLVAVVDGCEITDLEYNSLTSTSAVLTWQVFVCPLRYLFIFSVTDLSHDLSVICFSKWHTIESPYPTKWPTSPRTVKKLHWSNLLEITHGLTNRTIDGHF